MLVRNNAKILTRRTLQRSLTPREEKICVHISGGSFSTSLPDAIMKMLSPI